MALELTCRMDSQVPVEADCIRPEALAGLSLADIEKLEAFHGNTPVPLAEFFQIGGDPEDRVIHIEGDCSRVKMIGAGMSAGTIVIHGDAGMHLGAEMTGGEIEVKGRAGDWVGAEMKGGRIHVHGDAGHLAGGAYRGSRRGMTGGVILIGGRAGNEIGCIMRRGLIAVGGDTGDFAGAGMLAGSLLIFGKPGLRSGAGMKRGSIVFFNSPSGPEGASVELLPTFRYDCVYRPPFLGVYLRQLGAWGFPVNGDGLHGIYQRFSGDLIESGKGEILIRGESFQQKEPR